ncbi:retrograde regulation protein 2 [Trichomonascus vanleenenianus]|uniref:Rtg2p n=1 Tax=Trichomonascus vanleenenianus TaxID=2268995 RepID=UPI003ECB452E
MSEGQDPHNPHLRAIVDIGSNGIRFSISSTEPGQGRIIPCLFQDRVAISLFDAQYSSYPGTPEGSGVGLGKPHHPAAAHLAADDKQDIPGPVIEDVCRALLRFQSICHDFGVPEAHIHLIATEAVREAHNSPQFRAAIRECTGWDTNILSKEDEARTGAYGVASSFYEVQGLFVDLGGGSLQLSWITCAGGEFAMSPSPVSLPYGAAALTRRLTREPAPDAVRRELRAALSAALSRIDIPDSLALAAKESGGYKLYVTGGGFRGLGHLIIARHLGGQYPLPLINGFSCPASELSRLVSDIVSERETVTKRQFRISERRAHQIPSVALLVSAFLECDVPVRKVLFSQAGVREGAIFHDLPPEMRRQDPLIVATRPYAPLLAARYAAVLRQALPDDAPRVIRDRIAPAVVNVAFAHSSYPKDLQPRAALNIACTGIISGCHGLSHEIRALVGLALCQRWGGELPDNAFRDLLIATVRPRRLAWWAMYCGHLMHVIGGIYPGGNVRDDLLTIAVSDVTERGFRLTLRAKKDDYRTEAPSVKSRIRNLEKRLKKLSKEFDEALKVSVSVEWV